MCYVVNSTPCWPGEMSPLNQRPHMSQCALTQQRRAYISEWKICNVAILYNSLGFPPPITPHATLHSYPIVVIARERLFFYDVDHVIVSSIVLLNSG